MNDAKIINLKLVGGLQDVKCLQRRLYASLLRTYRSLLRTDVSLLN
jgi:hypothetical protein